jgi:hypothetical protein
MLIIVNFSYLPIAGNTNSITTNIQTVSAYSSNETLNKLGLLRFARNDAHFLPVIARSKVTKQSIKRGYARVP